MNDVAMMHSRDTQDEVGAQRLERQPRAQSPKPND
jgi:hypothetical protein